MNTFCLHPESEAMPEKKPRDEVDGFFYFRLSAATGRGSKRVLA